MPEIKGISIDRPSIYDLNHFARRLESMEEYQRKAMRAVLIRRQNEGVYQDGIMMGELINLTYGLDRLFDLIEQVGKRLANVVIENQDFETLIKHYDRENAFIYNDPPYVDTEGFYKGGFNMDSHIRLRDTLFGIKGKFLLSYNDYDIVRELYNGCDIIGFTRVHSMAQKYEAGKEFHELLIANYDIMEREKSQPYQLTFFNQAIKPTSVIY